MSLRRENPSIQSHAIRYHHVRRPARKSVGALTGALGALRGFGVRETLPILCHFWTIWSLWLISSFLTDQTGDLTGSVLTYTKILHVCKTNPAVCLHNKPGCLSAHTNKPPLVKLPLLPMKGTTYTGIQSSIPSLVEFQYDSHVPQKCARYQLCEMSTTWNPTSSDSLKLPFFGSSGSHQVFESTVSGVGS